MSNHGDTWHILYDQNTSQEALIEALADEIVTEAVLWANRMPEPLSVALDRAETWLSIMPMDNDQALPERRNVSALSEKEERELQEQIDRMAGESLNG